MYKINALYAEADVLLNGLLDDLDPQWREHQSENKAAKVSRKQNPKKEVIEMSKSNMVDGDVMTVLKSAWCEGFNVYLPPAQLERKLYERTNEVLTRIGGKWKGGKTKAHVFEDDPAPLLAEVLATGIMPLDNPLDFYATPPEVIKLAMSKVKKAYGGCPVPIITLEPSAGDGAFVKALRVVSNMFIINAYEVDEKRILKLHALNDKDLNIYSQDFLSAKNNPPYDLVVMNPPFTSPTDRKAYIAHVQQAFEWLRTGGLLIAVCPAGLKFNSDKRASALRELVLSKGTFEDLPPGAFGESGTMVSTVLVSMVK